jgi:hypothetical protein
MGQQKIGLEIGREIGLLRAPSQQEAIEAEMDRCRIDRPRERWTDNPRQHQTDNRRRRQTDNITHHPPDSHQAIMEVVPWVEATVADPEEEEALVAVEAGGDVSQLTIIKATGVACFEFRSSKSEIPKFYSKSTFKL